MFLNGNPDARFGLFCLLVETGKRAAALVLNGSLPIARVLSSEYQQVFVTIQGSNDKILRFSELGKTTGKQIETECCKDSKILSLKDRKFDLIVANDNNKTFNDFHRNPLSKDAQVLYISNWRSHLQEGGKFIIGVSNLLSIDFWRLRATAGDRKKLYGLAALTHWGYRRLFSRARYSSIKFHLAIPSHLEPKLTCHSDRRSRKWFYREVYPRPEKYPKKAVFRFMILLDVAHYFEPSFLIEAQR
jgi:SAM-dependent methyltransferase